MPNCLLREPSPISRSFCGVAPSRRVFLPWFTGRLLPSLPSFVRIIRSSIGPQSVSTTEMFTIGPTDLTAALTRDVSTRLSAAPPAR